MTSNESGRMPQNNASSDPATASKAPRATGTSGTAGLESCHAEPGGESSAAVASEWPATPETRAAAVDGAGQRALLELLSKRQLLELIEQLVRGKPRAAATATQLAAERLVSEAVDSRADALIAKLSDADESAERTLPAAMARLEAMLSRAARLADAGLREEALYSYFVCGEAFPVLLGDFDDQSCRMERCAEFPARLDRLIVQSLREYIIKCGAEPLSDFLLDALRRLEVWDEMLAEAGLGSMFRYSKALATEEILALLAGADGPASGGNKSPRSAVRSLAASKSSPEPSRRARRTRSNMSADESAQAAAGSVPPRSSSNLSTASRPDEGSSPAVPRPSRQSSSGMMVHSVSGGGFKLEACPSMPEPAELSLSLSADPLMPPAEPDELPSRDSPAQGGQRHDPSPSNPAELRTTDQNS